MSLSYGVYILIKNTYLDYCIHMLKICCKILISLEEENILGFEHNTNSTTSEEDKS